MRQWFFITFFASKLLRKKLSKFMLAPKKTLTESGDFTGSRIRISNTPQRKLETSIQPLKKPTDN
jgi:hypothetical protein